MIADITVREKLRVWTDDVAALISNSMMRLLPRSVLLHFVLDDCVRVSRRRCASGCGSLHADGQRSAGRVILADCTRVVPLRLL